MQNQSARVVGLKLRSKRLPRPVADWLRRQLDRLLGFHGFNELYGRFAPCKATEISQAFLDQLGVRVEMEGEPLSIVPREGPLLFVANHPHGLVDGFALDAQLTPTRPDGWLLGLYALGDVPEFRERLIMVDPRRRRSKRKQNLRAWREAHRLLANGQALVVFPAGAIARFDWTTRTVRDPAWSPHVAALARRTRAAVMPFHIHGRNGFGFQLAGLVSPRLQPLFIFAEMNRMRGRTLRITAGPPIPADTLAALPSDEAAIAYVRARAEALAGG